MNRFVIGAFMSIAAIAISACGGSNGEGGAGTSQSDLVYETPPAKGPVDQVTWNLLREPTTVDPIKTQTEAEGPVVANMCESLLTVTPEFELVPGLAESYRMTNPTTWVYQLRPGVRFWNGKPVTTDDVVYSLERSFGKTSTASGSYWPTYFTRVQSIRATGADEITIKLTKPDALLNRILATPAGAVIEKASSQAAGADLGTPSVGVMCSGPFKFRSWTPGKSISLESNADYWDSDRVPLTKTLDFEFVDNDSAISSALKTGELEGMYEVPVSLVQQLQQAESGKLYFGPGTRFLAMYPTETSLLRDPKLREALFLVMDRGGIADGIFPGAAEPMKSLMPPTFAYEEEAFNSYLGSIPAASPEADLEAARKLVEEYGPQDRPLVLATEATPSTVEVANQIQSRAKEIGLEVKVDVLTPNQNSALWFDKGLRGKYDGFLAYTFVYNAEPLDFLVYFTPESYYNYGLYKNTEFNERFNDALGTYDDEARAKKVIEAYKIVDNELPWIPIVYQPQRLFINNEITGVPTSWAYVWSAWADRLGSN